MRVSLELSSGTKKFCGVTNNRQFELSFRVLTIFVSFELSFVFGKIHRNSTNFVCITFAQYCTVNKSLLILLLKRTLLHLIHCKVLSQIVHSSRLILNQT